MHNALHGSVCNKSYADDSDCLSVNGQCVINVSTVCVLIQVLPKLMVEMQQML